MKRKERAILTQRLWSLCYVESDISFILGYGHIIDMSTGVLESACQQYANY
jgi:hypothetical protein